jgi:hypothetical protein
MIGGLDNEELEMMWKEVVVAYFRKILRNILEETEENHEEPLSG